MAFLRWLPIQPQTDTPLTGIICTINPGTITRAMVDDFIKSGMRIARFNFSHVIPKQYSLLVKQMRMVKQRGRLLNRPIGIMMDLAGPEIRTGPIDPDPCTLHVDAVVALQVPMDKTLREGLPPGDASVLWLNRTSFFEAKPGDEVYVGDQPIVLRIGARRPRRGKDRKEEIVCTILEGGEVGARTTVFVLGRKLKFNVPDTKDSADLKGIAEECGKDIPIDYVACSFVRDANDLIAIRGAVVNSFDREIPLIAKLETAECVQDTKLDGILEALSPFGLHAGAVMIARGDLALALSAEDVPAEQRKILQRASAARVPSIVATQMLHNMILNPRPTRAEAEDIWSAVAQYADCVMLSGETASKDAKFPKLAVETLRKIVKRAEGSRLQRPIGGKAIRGQLRAAAEAGVELAQNLNSRAIVLSTDSGKTPAEVAYYKPERPILALTSNVETEPRLLLYGGVFPMLHEFQHTDPNAIGDWLQLFEEALDIQGLCRTSPSAQAPVVTLFGLKPGTPVTAQAAILQTNTIRIVEEPLCSKVTTARRRTAGGRRPSGTRRGDGRNSKQRDRR